MSKNLRNPNAQLNSFSVNTRLGALGAFGRNQSAAKLSNQTVTSSVTPVNDNDLFIYLGSAPKTTYYFRLVAQLSIGAAANNLRYQFAGPDGLVIDANLSGWMGFWFLSGVAPQVDATQSSLGAGATGGTTNAWTCLVVEGIVRPEQPGTFQFQFAQGVSGATNSTVKAGSTLMAWELPA